MIANPDYAFVPLPCSHFGTDTAGLVRCYVPSPRVRRSITSCDTQNTTRRYLCEALSFQYRYVPIGLLEYLPGKINDRPPAYRGRNELGRRFLIPPEEILQLIYLTFFFQSPVSLTETLLASPDSRDWVKISEMFLGPAPDAWTFVPKHKSNAFESQG